MYRTALRSASRPVSSTLRTSTLRAAPRRFASTASPADRPRTWKGAGLRWGLAAAAVYWYNTSPVFADEAAPQTIPAPGAFQDDQLPTVDAVLEQKRRDVKSKLETKPDAEKKKESTKTQPDAAQSATTAASGSPAALEEEAGQQGAFNPETGEINWDCPCLGGMADGPCGEEFKTAFSCFVYSTEEPKGMDCIEKFQGMQECFKKYPDIYGSELADDDAEEEADAALGNEPPIADIQKDTAAAPAAATVAVQQPKPEVSNVKSTVEETKPVGPPAAAWEDATAANQEVLEEEKKTKAKKVAKAN